MRHKNIKLIIKKQLKKDCLDWRKLSKKEKKALVKQVAEAIIEDYDFEQSIEAPVEELLGIENQIPDEDIIPLEYIDKLINDFRSASRIDANEIKRFHVHIKDDALKFIVRSRRSLITQCAVATMATPLIEMERRREDRDNLQLQFDMAS